MDRTADPCQDFYQFACGGYTARTAVPPDRSRTSMFSQVGDLLTEQLKSLLSGPGRAGEPEPLRLARDLFTSCLGSSHQPATVLVSP